MFLTMSLLLICCSDNDSNLDTVIFKDLVLENGEIIKMSFDDNGSALFETAHMEKLYSEFVSLNPKHGIYISDTRKHPIIVSSIEKAIEFDQIDNPISNLKANSRATASFYDDRNFRDRRLTVTTTTCIEDDDLRNTYSTVPRKRGFNDKTSSVQVTGVGRLIMYDDRNFEDRFVMFSFNGFFPIRDFTWFTNPETNRLDSFNDKMSSYVLMCQPNFGMRCR